MQATTDFSTDVVVKLGNMSLPARVTAKEDERFTITIKYSKLALELDLVSVTMSLPPSRIEFDEPLESFHDVKSFQEVKCQQPEDPGHTANVSASSELSSYSSEWHDSVERFQSGEIMFALTQEFQNDVPVRKRLSPPGTSISSWELGAEVLKFSRSLLPDDAFYFHDLVYATRDSLQEALDAENVENLIIEFLAGDPRFFVVSIPDLGYSPITWHRWAQQFLLHPGAFNGWEALCDAPATAVARSGVLSSADVE
jgi:hypothetical protein